MFSDLPADHIVASHRKEVQSAATQSRPEPVLPPVLTHNTTFSTGIQLVSTLLVFHLLLTSVCPMLRTMPHTRLAAIWRNSKNECNIANYITDFHKLYNHL